ncbi:MAG: MBL fold metallo-hydrolase [Candidatus Krumholzibacteriota bacterium]|nr:MBL fold metallo-hydrolase [Candidatus Krumholzibacteriota bacterium]
MTRRAIALALAILPVLAGCGRESGGPGLVRVSEHVYAMVADGPSAAEGLGANSGFVVGDEAVLVVDTRYTPALARELLEAIRGVTDLPVRWAVNTHYHPDHAWGNAVFRDAGATILARPETAEDLRRFSPVYLDYYRAYRPEAWALLRDVEIAPPDSLLGEMLEIDLGGIMVLVRYFGPGHTAGDAVVFVPKERVVFTGGLAAAGYHPNLGDDGADLANWLRIIGEIEATGPRRVVPGNGFVSGPGVLGETADYIRYLLDLCERHIRGGGSAFDVATSVAVPGTEGDLLANLVPFNVRAVYVRLVQAIVDPPFTLDLPDGFRTTDGAVEGRGGRIDWAADTADGYLEIEVRWQPTVRSEVITQDVYDEVSRYTAATKRHRMHVAGPETVSIGGVEAVGAHGRWEFTPESGRSGGGIWTWGAILRDGVSYTVQLSVNANKDEAAERRGMETLQAIAATFRFRADGP